jgi:hypothetical protein
LWYPCPPRQMAFLEAHSKLKQSSLINPNQEPES